MSINPTEIIEDKSPALALSELEKDFAHLVEDADISRNFPNQEKFVLKLFSLVKEELNLLKGIEKGIKLGFIGKDKMAVPYNNNSSRAVVANTLWPQEELLRVAMSIHSVDPLNDSPFGKLYNRRPQDKFKTIELNYADKEFLARPQEVNNPLRAFGNQTIILIFDAGGISEVFLQSWGDSKINARNMKKDGTRYQPAYLQLYGKNARVRKRESFLVGKEYPIKDDDKDADAKITEFLNNTYILKYKINGDYK